MSPKEGSWMMIALRIQMPEGRGRVDAPSRVETTSVAQEANSVRLTLEIIRDLPTGLRVRNLPVPSATVLR